MDVKLVKDANLFDNVIAVGDLKQFGSYAARRAFKASYDCFVACKAVLPLLPKKLGKAFKGAYPLGVDFPIGKERVDEIKGGVWVYNGQTVTVKVGRVGMSAKEVAENVQAFLESMKESVEVVYLKGRESIALPIYLQQKGDAKKDAEEQEHERKVQVEVVEMEETKEEKALRKKVLGIKKRGIKKRAAKE